MIHQSHLFSASIVAARLEKESAEEVPVAERPAMEFATRAEEEEVEAAPVESLPKATAGLEDV
jgi:hypothetical protein